MKRTAKLSALVLFAILATGAIFSTSHVEAQQTPPAAATDKKLLERLGADDGFALSIQFSGDIQGSLEPCG